MDKIIQMNNFTINRNSHESDEEDNLYFACQAKKNNIPFLETFKHSYYNHEKIGVSFFYKFDGCKQLNTMIFKEISEISGTKIRIGKYIFSPNTDLGIYKYSIFDYVKQFGRPTSDIGVYEMTLHSHQSLNCINNLVVNEGIYKFYKGKIPRDKIEQGMIIEKYLKEIGMLNMDDEE